MQNSYNNFGGQMSPMISGSMMQTLDGGMDSPFNPNPLSYTACAGDYCVTCVTVWDANNKRWLRKCYHYKLIITDGEWLNY